MRPRSRIDNLINAGEQKVIFRADFIDVLEIVMSKFNARWSVINYWIHVFDKTLGCIMYICFMIMFAINLVNVFTGDYVILSFPSHSEHMKFYWKLMLSNLYLIWEWCGQYVWWIIQAFSCFQYSLWSLNFSNNVLCTVLNWRMSEI